MIRQAKASIFDPQAWLGGELDEALRRCGALDQGLHVDLETTFAEIVEVALTNTKLDADAQTCVRQMIWTLELPSEFELRFATWSFDR